MEEYNLLDFLNEIYIIVLYYVYKDIINVNFGIWWEVWNRYKIRIVNVFLLCLFIVGCFNMFILLVEVEDFESGFNYVVE